VTTSSFMCVCGVELGERRLMRMPVVAHMLVEPIIVVRGRVGEVERGAGRAVVVRNGAVARIGEVQRGVEAEGGVGGHSHGDGGHSDAGVDGEASRGR
jgi:hypothetical protein